MGREGWRTSGGDVALVYYWIGVRLGLWWGGFMAWGL